MHIVFVTSEMPKKDNYGGGLATFTVNIASIFKQKGNQVEILYVSTMDEQNEIVCDVDVINVYIPKTEWDVYDYVSQLYCCGDEADVNRREIIKIMKSKAVRDEINILDGHTKVDIVHFSNHGSFSIMMDNHIPYVIRISGFLNILNGGASTPHGSLEYLDNPLSINDKLEIYALKKANRTFAPSRYIANIGKRNIGIDIDVLESPFVNNIADKDESIYINYGLDRKRYLLFYGNLRYLKGIQVIADLVGKLLENYSEIHMVLAGIDMDVMDDNGNVIKASEYVRNRAGLYRDRVIYLGKLRHTELFPVIENAEACLFPSRIENLSNACIEAMSLGKIVIATDGASFEQLIEDGENGFLCERDNAESFYTSIEKVINLSNNKKERLENKAKKTVERLESNIVYEKFYQYYQSVIDDFNDNR